MEDFTTNPADISKNNREKLIEAWNDLDLESTTPSD